MKIDTEGSEDKVLAGLSRPIDQFLFEVHAGLRDVVAGAFARLEELGVYEYRVMERESWRFSGPKAAGAILEHCRIGAMSTPGGSMLARKTLPEQFLRWNRRWGAPFGRNRLPHRLALTVAPARWRPWIVGPFGFQPDNSATRRFEYPWAFHATTLRRGMTAVDLGGSLAGLQFVLDKAGLAVVNVDPSDAAPMGWPVDAATFRALNRAFGTNVELRRAFLEDASVEDASVDRVFCISTLEHVPDDAIASILREIRRILRPGGQCVLTVDLFLDLAPFTDRAMNASGRNVDLSWVVEASGLTLTTGDRGELNGFPEFDPRRVQASLGDLLYATHVPALTQALVLTRPTS